MISRLSRIAACCAPLVAGTVLFSLPAAASSVLFILDGSGSMWERVDGQPKIAIAKKVLGDVLHSLPADTAIGLMTYGTHRKGDCSDITMLTPVAPSTAGAIAQQVNALTPVGETPIAASLLKAGAALKTITGKKVLVLVTDGAEECHGDPCASVKQLQAQGLDVEINVVGFNLGDKARAAIKCVAEQGHGQYYEAKNAAGLATAMKAVQTEVAQNTAPAPVKTVAEHLYGTPIRGGDAVDSAVALKTGTLYHLNYDQPTDKRDFFKVTAKSGQGIAVTLTGGNTNTIQGEIMNSKRVRVAGTTSAGTRNKALLPYTVSYGNDGTYTVVIESAGYGGHVGPDATFQVDLVNQADGNGGRDAGSDQNGALELKPGVYTQNYIDATDDTDMFKITLPAGKVFQFKVRPSATNGLMTLSAVDGDGVQLQSASAPNGGAVAKLDKLVLPKGGVVFVKVGYGYGAFPGFYSIAVGPGDVASPPIVPAH